MEGVYAIASIIFIVLIIIGIIVLYMRSAREIPILMYHSISQSSAKLSVSPQLFEQHLKLLHSQGYTTISLSDLYRHYSAGELLPIKPIILTFDDAYEDNFTVALPLLKSFGMKGTLFVITDWVGKHNDWENYPGKPVLNTMTWEQIRKWKEAGMEVGSHTADHLFLSNLDKDEIKHQLGHSKKVIEENLGENVNFLCYPYGNFDYRVKKFAVQAKYKLALAIDDKVPLWRTDLFAMRRILISSRHNELRFAAKVSKWNHILVSLKTIKRRMI